MFHKSPAAVSMQIGMTALQIRPDYSPRDSYQPSSLQEMRDGWMLFTESVRMGSTLYQDSHYHALIAELQGLGAKLHVGHYLELSHVERL